MEHVTAADRIARDHRNNGLGETSDLDLQIEDVQVPEPTAVDVLLAEVAVVTSNALVSSGGEGLGPLPGENDDPDLGILAGSGERVHQFVDREGTKGVAHLGPTDRDLGHPVGGFIGDVAVCRGRLPRWQFGLGARHGGR